MFEVKAFEFKIVNSHQSHSTPQALISSPIYQPQPPLIYQPQPSIHQLQPSWETITVPLDIPHEAILASALLTTEDDLEPRTHRQARSCPDAERWN